MAHRAWSKKIGWINKIFSSFLLLLIFTVASYAITPLESNLRKIRDDYRHSPYEGMQKIKKLWGDFSGINDRVHIFLDLNHYYQKHSLDKLLLSQGKWLLNKNIPSEKSRIWTTIPVAETLAALGKTDESVECYEKAFALGCILLGKNPKDLSREDFIKSGVEGTAIFGKTAKNTALNFAKAGKFNDAYDILKSSKTMSNENDFDPEKFTPDSEKNIIIILGIFEKKYSEACGKLKLLNSGNPFLTIEKDTIQTPEEEICLKAKDYKLLADVYINTLIINPPCEFITYQKITANGRSTIYILNKISDLFDNKDFSISFEKALKEKIKESNLSHLNILLAEYYLINKDFKKAAEYFKIAANQSTRLTYCWPKYYPDLDLNGNYRSPHRPHLWINCSELAKDKLGQINKD